MQVSSTKCQERRQAQNTNLKRSSEPMVPTVPTSATARVGVGVGALVSPADQWLRTGWGLIMAPI